MPPVRMPFSKRTIGMAWSSGAIMMYSPGAACTVVEAHSGKIVSNVAAMRRAVFSMSGYPE